MRAIGMRPIQITFAVLAAAMIAVALLLLSGGSTDASHGETVESAFSVEYTATVADTTPGADRELTTVLTIPFPNHVNFSNLITFDPASTITQTCNTTTSGSGAGGAWAEGDVSDEHTLGGACLKSGELVGTLSSLTDLATNNNPCGAASSLTIDFDLYAVPTPNLDGGANARDSSNIVYTRPEGAGSRFDRWGWESDKALPGDDFIQVAGGTGVTYVGAPPVRAASTNIMFHGYPEYLLDLFSTAGDGGSPLVPQAVYGGLTLVAGTPVPLYFVYFNPGALAAEFTAPNPLGRATANLGFANQTVLNDPTPPTGNPSTVTAFCATEPTTILNATVDGVSRSKNPVAVGTGLNLIWAASQRDLDNDGIENSVDTCPADTDVDGDPRPFGGDIDGDNIDGACDPAPTPGAGGNQGDDVDSDGWPNQQDNCEQTANASQLESEGLLGVQPGYDAGNAADGGSLGDSLGDACDSEIGPLTVLYNGLLHDGVTDHDPGAPVLILPKIVPSDSVSNGRWQVRAIVSPICYGGTDLDGDGYCAEDTDVLTDGDAVKHNSWTLTPALSAVLGVTTAASAGSWDTDGGSGSGAGFDSDWVETYVGTDARQPCSLSPIGLVGVTPDEPLGAYMYDYNTDKFVDFGDILPIAAVFGVNATTDAHKRFDWNADGFVDFGDILTIAPAFGKFCSPVVLPQ